MSETRQEFLNEADKLECHILAGGTLSRSEKLFKNTWNLYRNTVPKEIAVTHQKIALILRYRSII